MKIKSKQKRKSIDKKPPIEGSWSKVKIAGNLITNDGGGLEGLVGLEVLETYDKNIISKAKVRNCSWCDILLCYTMAFNSQKSKKREREDNDDGLDDKTKTKPNKKPKVNQTAQLTPGRYVLMSKQTDDEQEDAAEEPEEEEAEIETTDLIVRKQHLLPPFLWEINFFLSFL